MAQFEIAFGFSCEALNRMIQAFYKKPAAKEKIFCGEVQGVFDGQEYKAKWEIAQAPELDFAGPDSKAWEEAVGPDGKANRQELLKTGMLQLIFPDVRLTLSDAVELGKLILYAKISVCTAENALSLEPLALDEAQSSLQGFDRALFNALIVPELFKVIGNAVKRIPLPAQVQQVFGQRVELLKPELVLTDPQLILATSRKGHPLNAQGAAWPEGKAVFVLVSPEFAAELSRDEIKKQLTKLDIRTSGKTKENMEWRCELALRDVKKVEPVPGRPLQLKLELEPYVEAQATSVNKACPITAAAET